MTSLLPRTFGIWVLVMFVATLVMGFAFVGVQQGFRHANNDPQIQIAEDAAALLTKDYTPAAVVPRTGVFVDIATQLDTWIAVYDSAGKPLESNAVLDGAPPELPAGVFDSSSWASHKRWETPGGLETRFTWQPRDGVRQAVVLIQFDGPHGKSYVAAGRSMRLVEERIEMLMAYGAAAWGTAAVGSLVLIFALLAAGVL